jgi:hypothetical protein
MSTLQFLLAIGQNRQEHRRKQQYQNQFEHQHGIYRRFDSFRILWTLPIGERLYEVPHGGPVEGPTAFIGVPLVVGDDFLSINDSLTLNFGALGP